jgi:hypothetical protein
MEPGLAARLNPREEITLRRIAHAATNMDELHAGHLNRLASLNLVSLDGDTVSLTDLGKQRIAQAK